MRKALLLLALVDCKSEEAAEATPPIAVPVTFVSGTRLRAMLLEVDGVRVFVGWQDVQLGKPCTFLEGRCLPGTTRFEQASSGLYEDDACTARLATVSEGSAYDGPFDTLALVDGTGICSPISIHVRGDRVSLPRVFRRDELGACVDLGAGGDFVRVGPALGPDDHTFVMAKEESDTSGGRIVMRWLVAEDGARELIGAWDNERNESVAVAVGEKRWYPRDRAKLASASSCAGIATSSTCKPSVVFVGGDACREPSIAALGAPVDASACASALGAPAYEVGLPIPNKSFAPAQTVIVGSGRVRLAMNAREDGRALVPRSLVDTEGDTMCEATESAESPGTIRCRPSADARITKVFTNEGCTEPAVLFTPGAGACDLPPTVPHFVSVQFALFEVGARIGAAWLEDSSDTCSPIELTGDRSAYAVTPLDPSRLAIVTQRTE